MKKIFPLFICCFFLISAAQTQAAQLMLSKGMPHYIREIEFYYQKPRPEILPKILSVFSREGGLNKSEDRLILAAFLSELIRQGQLKPQIIVDEAMSLGKNAKHTAAWCLHLAQTPKEKEHLAQLAAQDDKYLFAQIARSPASLAAWDITREKSVPLMYWAAFMASGKDAWIDPIIDLALLYARGQGNFNSAAGATAAATLYEFAPRHPIVRQKLKSRLPGKNPGENKMLSLILEHAGK